MFGEGNKWEGGATWRTTTNMFNVLIIELDGHTQYLFFSQPCNV